MRTKKIVIVAVLALCTVLFLEHNAFAAPGFYVCDVESAGIVRDSEVLIDLTHNEIGKTSQFTNLRFTAKLGRETEMLATALTALTSGLQVRVWTDPEQGTTELRVLTSMFILYD